MKHVLIVDDCPDIRELVRLALGGKYLVSEAADARSAIEVLYRHAPDLIVLDVMLPGAMSGLHLLTMVRVDPNLSEIPVVIVTACRLPEERQSALERGADAYYTKPFSPLDLADYINDRLT